MREELTPLSFLACHCHVSVTPNFRAILILIKLILNSVYSICVTWRRRLAGNLLQTTLNMLNMLNTNFPTRKKTDNKCIQLFNGPWDYVKLKGRMTTESIRLKQIHRLKCIINAMTRKGRNRHATECSVSVSMATRIHWRARRASERHPQIYTKIFGHQSLKLVQSNGKSSHPSMWCCESVICRLCVEIWWGKWADGNSDARIADKTQTHTLTIIIFHFQFDAFGGFSANCGSFDMING